jgi:hypothetical protein
MSPLCWQGLVLGGEDGQDVLGSAGVAGQEQQRGKTRAARRQDMAGFEARVRGQAGNWRNEGHTNLVVGYRHFAHDRTADALLSPDGDAVDTLWSWCRSEWQQTGPRTDIFSRLSSGPCGCPIHWL